MDNSLDLSLFLNCCGQKLSLINKGAFSRLWWFQNCHLLLTTWCEAGAHVISYSDYVDAWNSKEIDF